MEIHKKMDVILVEILLVLIKMIMINNLVREILDIVKLVMDINLVYIEPDEHNAIWDTCHYFNHNCVCCGKEWDNWNKYYDRVSVMLANESW